MHLFPFPHCTVCHDFDSGQRETPFNIRLHLKVIVGWITVSIATVYGLDGPGIESRWGRDFLPVQTSPGAHPASCTMGTRSFPGVKYGQGVLLTTHPLLAPRSWNSRAIPLPTLWATTRPVAGYFTFT